MNGQFLRIQFFHSAADQPAPDSSMTVLSINPQPRYLPRWMDAESADQLFPMIDTIMHLILHAADIIKIILPIDMNVLRLIS